MQWRYSQLSQVSTKLGKVQVNSTRPSLALSELLARLLIHKD